MKENSCYSLLIVGIINDHHIQRFIKHLRSVNSSARIDFLATTINDNVPQEVLSCVDNLYVAAEISKKNSFIEPLLKFTATLKVLKSIQSNHYDVVNIQNAHYYRFFYIKYLRRMTNTILLTPWGSEIYRVNGIRKFLLKKLIKSVDVVTTANNKFGNDVKRLFKLPKEKTVCLDIGSDTIDYITENLITIDKATAKKELNVEGKYVITCSYNGSPTHKHEIIIDAINRIKDQLPDNLVLFFPFTYAAPQGYSSKLKSQMDHLGIKYLFFEKYLSVKELFLLRRAADVFIHIQPSDANSQSLQEYLLCGSKVVNGEWLRYSELECDGVMPYYVVKDLDDLSEVLLMAYKADSIVVPQKTIEYIRSYGWREWIRKWNSYFCTCCK